VGFSWNSHVKYPVIRTFQLAQQKERYAPNRTREEDGSNCYHGIIGGKIQPTEVSIMQENTIARGKSIFLILLEYKETSLTGNSFALVQPKLGPFLGYGEIPNYSCC
jgi:hypothetical protein